MADDSSGFWLLLVTGGLGLIILAQTVALSPLALGVAWVRWRRGPEWESYREHLIWSCGLCTDPWLRLTGRLIWRRAWGPN